MTSAEANWVCVLGPPGVGKATVAAGLAELLAAPVFQWRVFARAHNIAALSAEQSVDPRGEYNDLVVDRMLRDALLHGRMRADGGHVVLPDFPTTVEQLLLLHSVARTSGVLVRVVELDAINGLVMSRAHFRRLCLACTADPGGNPHDAAPHDPNLPNRCPTCGGPLARRCSDIPALYLDRLSRYRARRPALRDTARDARIPWFQIDASRTPAEVLAAARDFVTARAEDVVASPDRGPADVIPRPRIGEGGIDATEQSS
jgi:adenylate kinase family enzyme